jgi:hypothetical protein
MRYPHKPADKGQGTSEYALAVGLVSLVCLVGLTQLGGEVSAMFGNTLVTRPPSLNPNVTPVIATNTNPLSPTVATNSSYDLSQVCLDQSLCVELPDFPNGVTPQKSQEVAGGYGELSKQYAKALEDLVQQIQADPKYQDLNLASIVQLAKNGHILADNLIDIQEICKSKNKNQASGQCQYDASTWGSLYTNNDPVRMRNNFLNAQEAALAFLQQSEALPPHVKNLIEDLSDQILDLHETSIGKELESVEGVADKNVCQRKSKKGKKLPKRCKTTTTQANISVDLDAEADVITLDANTICQTGTRQTNQCVVKSLLNKK